MESLLLLGLNHETAPLDLRERLALSVWEQEELLRELIRRRRVDEAVVLVTCNRVELYVVAEAIPATDDLADLLAAGRDVDPDDVLARAYLKLGMDAASHAFHVAAGLDSMMVGETQVLGQWRDAYERARRWGTVGRTLDPMMQRAIACARDVSSRAGLAKLRPSLASAAVEFVDRELGGLRGKTVVCVGAGKIGTIALRRLRERGAARCIVVNRSATRRDEVAGELGAEAAGLGQLRQVLAVADVVFSSTGSREPVITRRMVELARRDRAACSPLVMIDLAVPRDIEPSTGKLGGVRLLNVDDLKHSAAKQSPERATALDRARVIVREHLGEYEAWRRQQALGPAIDRLYRHSHALAEREVERALADFPHIGDEEREHWRELARRVVNQLLHRPVRRLGESECPHSCAEAYLHALEQLFSPSEDDGDAATSGYPAPRDTGKAPRE